MQGAKNVKLYYTLPFPRQTFDSKCPTVGKSTSRQRKYPKGMVTLQIN